jgi:hypothetical protein
MPEMDKDDLQKKAADAKDTAQEKARNAAKSAKERLDHDRDGKTDMDDVKSMAKDAASKVKGLLHKS